MSKSSRRTAPPAGGTVAADEAASSSTPASTRPVRPTSRRAGRRERTRPLAEKSFGQRYRLPIIVVAVVAGVALLGIWAFGSAGAAAYSCSTVYQPGATPSPAPGGTPTPGYVQPDMGNRHVQVGSEVAYTYCPPATGSHYNVVNRGPVSHRVYGPDDQAIPQGWVHNLEHGALVVLYRGQEGDPGLTEDAQQQFRDFFGSAPNSPVCGRPPGEHLIITRFDEMATPYAALVWGRMLPLDSFDPDTILGFFQSVGEREGTMPERLGCPLPAASPAASPSPS